MNVVMAVKPDENPFISQLVEALESQDNTSVIIDPACNWRDEYHSDTLLHIHWPEGIFDFNEPDEDQLEELEKRLNLWDENAAIVCTVHNYHPHNRDKPIFKRLYEMVYRHARGIIHMGEASREWFINSDYTNKRQSHSIIPHGNYASYENEISSEQARKALGYKEDDVIILNFGQLRTGRELPVLFRAFSKLKIKNKQLLSVGSTVWPSRRKNLYDHIYCKVKSFFDSRICIVSGFMNDSKVQYYFNAADLVVVPRVNQLNSGLVALGFTFGKVVIGSDRGVMGEVLRKTGNPVCDPEDVRSLAFAMEKGIELSKKRIGKSNFEYANTIMDWTRIATMHHQFYQEVLNPA